MKCRTVQIEIGSGLALGPAARAHLSACEKCRRFAAGLEDLRLLGGSGPATQPDLRERTLDHCQRLLAEKSAPQGLTFGRRFRRLVDSPSFIAAFAASSVIILVGLTALQVDGLQDKTAGNILKIVIAQLAVQNLAAALFLPALMFINKNLGVRLPNTTKIGV